MSAVKERIREFEERLTPSTSPLNRTPSRRALIVQSPMMTTPVGSEQNKKQMVKTVSVRRMDTNGTPFLSPPRPVRAKTLAKSAMADVTNELGAPSRFASPTRLPKPRKLNLTSGTDENQCNSLETVVIGPSSSVQKRKEELDRRNRNMRQQLETREAQLGRAVTKDTDSTAYFKSRNGSNEELLVPFDLDTPTKGRRQQRQQAQPRTLKRFWEYLYAFLAILELLTCHGLQDVTQMNIPKAFVPSPSVSMSIGYERAQPQSARMNPFGVNGPRQRYWGEGIPTKLVSEWIWQLSWQELINKVFMVAIFIHTLTQSWSIASSMIHDKRKREQQEAIASATKVTRRSKRRFQNLETISSNRHFIMRWTRNKIRWRSATTEIVRVSVAILVVGLLFLPILKKNRVVTIIESNSRQGSKLPFLSPIYIPKDGLEMTIEIAGRTLSYGEAVLLDICAWLRSRAVTHLRRKVKEYAIRFATLALTRPWEASARVQTTFTVIRWTKFVAPLVGSCNKLRGQVADYKKKRQLKCRSDRANLLWSHLVKNVLVEKRTDWAVRRIQRSFRSNRQASQSQMQIDAQDASLEKAVVNLQRKFRERNSKSRLRLRRARKRLSEIGVGRQIVSHEQRDLADNLRREIRERSRKNRRLLLRPNTTLLLVWKRVTITCVLIEVSYKILAAILASDAGKMTMDELILYLLTPAAERLAPLSWYQVSFVAATFVSQRITNLVSMVSFLDVFITFFTGEFDTKTGVLVPKRAFARYFFPGIALQLIVNPTMKDISAIVKKILAFSNNIGPMRLFHVAVALSPIVRTFALSLVDIMFHFVDYENRNCP